MTNPTFRALCAEILQKLDQYEDGQRVDWDAWRNNARAELVKPDPVAPTDQELLRLYQVATPCYAVEKYKRELDFARAVWRLARWGAPANTTREGELG
jgi:hypothetical protein